MATIMPALRAATAFATALEGTGAVTIPVRVALVPRVCEVQGELEGTIYVVPTSQRSERLSRGAWQRDVTIAVIFLAPAASEDAAQALLEDFQKHLDTVMKVGRSLGVAFVSVSQEELLDASLLADQAILRSQADISCMLLDKVS